MGINFQRLLDVAKATECLTLPDFHMETVRCGTAGCLVGNYNAMVRREPSTFGDGGSEPDWEHFGITEQEYWWLFADNDYANLRTNRHWRELCNVTRQEALSRLRKFIYYKLRKNEFIVDEKYGVREEARHAEGDHGFAMRAKQQAEELATA